MIFTVFTACSKGQGSGSDTKVQNTKPTIATEEAKIKNADAINFIEKSYTKEELGLDKTDKDYSFMVSSSGVEIEGKMYVKVVANVMVKKDVTNKDGKETFTMETLGEYFISFDGDKVLKKNRETGEYIELENKYPDYSAKGQGVTEHNHSDDETTKS